MRSILYVLGTILFLIVRYNMPRKRQIRVRRRAEQQRAFDLENLHRDCQKLYHDAVLETPYLRYQQDVCWIEWHSKLADPECEDPGRSPALLTPEQIASDPIMFLGRFRAPAVLSFRRVEKVLEGVEVQA